MNCDDAEASTSEVHRRLRRHDRRLSGRVAKPALLLASAHSQLGECSDDGIHGTAASRGVAVDDDAIRGEGTAIGGMKRMTVPAEPHSTRPPRIGRFHTPRLGLSTDVCAEGFRA